jgi:hypothetical protein
MTTIAVSVFFNLNPMGMDQENHEFAQPKVEAFGKLIVERDLRHGIYLEQCFASWYFYI